MPLLFVNLAEAKNIFSHVKEENPNFMYIAAVQFQKQQNKENKVKKSCSAVPFQQNLWTNFYCWYWLNVLLFEFSFEVVIARAWLTFQRTKKTNKKTFLVSIYSTVQYILDERN
jgi:hypothetical protein